MSYCGLMSQVFGRDTAPEVCRQMLAGLASMTPADKLARLSALNRSVEEMALAGARLRIPGATDLELKLEVARLWLDEASWQAVRQRLLARQ